MKSFPLIIALVLTISATAQQSFDRKAVTEFQQELNSNFKDPETSPLPKNDIAGFSELDFFPPDPTFFVNARFVRTPDAKPFSMKTSTARLPVYVVYGTLYFELEGQPCELNVYQNVESTQKSGMDDYLFLPFSDLTNGDETYIGGRYIDMRIPTGETMTIDFNKAYNPYCAYSPRYSCPKIPLENDLPIAIRAGVKKYHD